MFSQATIGHISTIKDEDCETSSPSLPSQCNSKSIEVLAIDRDRCNDSSGLEHETFCVGSNVIASYQSALYVARIIARKEVRGKSAFKIHV